MLFFTEQDIRRRELTQFPTWVPRSKEHKPDGYTRIVGAIKAVTFAYEVELSPKSLDRFEFFTFKPDEIKQAGEFLDEWVRGAKEITLEAFKYFVEYIGRHRDRILNIIKTGRSSSFSEAINRKINVLIGMAYGYRSLAYLKLKILQRCGVIGKYWKPEDRIVPGF